MAEEKSDQVMPAGKWQFDQAVTEVFDDMLKRSIPQYELMRKLTFDLGCEFVQRGSTIIDLGCSHGEALQPFIDKFGVSNRYFGIEVSQPMLEAARKRYAGFIQNSFVDIREMDLRKQYPRGLNSSLVLSVLTLQFIPIEYRQELLGKIIDELLPGGALILVEKVLANGPKLDRIYNQQYWNLKAEHGYSQDQIASKRESLEGVLVPVSYNFNEHMLREAGFKTVDCFWRYLNFAGLIAIKGDSK